LDDEGNHDDVMDHFARATREARNNRDSSPKKSRGKEDRNRNRNTNTNTNRNRNKDKDKEDEIMKAMPGTTQGTSGWYSHRGRVAFFHSSDTNQWTQGV
jgi:hypothetical protein